MPNFRSALNVGYGLWGLFILTTPPPHLATQREGGTPHTEAVMGNAQTHSLVPHNGQFLGNFKFRETAARSERPQTREMEATKPPHALNESENIEDAKTPHPGDSMDLLSFSRFPFFRAFFPPFFLPIFLSSFLSFFRSFSLPPFSFLPSPLSLFPGKTPSYHLMARCEISNDELGILTSPGFF